MVKQLMNALIVFMIGVSTSYAQTYIRDYTYTASEMDSKLSSRTIALDQVKILLLQEIGTHIRQEIKISKDGNGNTYASDDVEAITAGLTKVDIIEEKWNGEVYYLKAKIDADADSVLKALEEIKKEKSEEKKQQLESLKISQGLLKDARNEIALLRSKLLNNKKESQVQSVVDKYNKGVEAIAISEMIEKGYKSSQSGDYSDTFYWFKKAAEKGFAPAQSDVGILYYYGTGVAQDDQQAVAWYQKAVAQGYVTAQYNLGLMYVLGKGVTKDVKQAAELFRKAAEQGDANAQFNIGNMYRTGEGVSQDYDKAIFWYSKALERGDPKAVMNLASMYLFGLGVEKDINKFLSVYRKGAERGNPDIQYRLGVIYFEGKVVQQNYEEAIVWFRQAAEQGSPVAQYSLAGMSYNGIGIKQDKGAAKKWFTKGCDVGYKYSCDALSTLSF